MFTFAIFIVTFMDFCCPMWILSEDIHTK